MNFQKQGPFSKRRLLEEFRLDLTSMTDIVTLLIIFLLITATFQTSSGIPVKLPGAQTQAPSEDVERVLITIKADGSLFFKNKPVDDAGLRDGLKAASASDPQTLVVIRADKSVPHGRVVSVMDAARMAGLTRLAIATIRNPTR